MTSKNEIRTQSTEQFFEPDSLEEQGHEYVYAKITVPQRILCKRFSTKSRISRYQCAGWGLIPLGYISPGRLGRYARRMRRECRRSLPGILFQGE